jgi:hypothetical protein
MIIEYDMTGLIPLFNDFFSFTPLRKKRTYDKWRIKSIKTFREKKYKYLKPEENYLEKEFLKIRKKKKTSQNSYGGRVASLMQTYYLTHLRKVYIPGNTNWTKGYHKKLNYRRSLPNILIETKESPRKSKRIGVITQKAIEN